MSVAGFDHRTCVIFALCVWWSVYLVKRKIRLFTAWSPPSTHAVTARVTAARLAPGFCFAGLVVLRPATDRASERSLPPSLLRDRSFVWWVAGPQERTPAENLRGSSSQVVGILNHLRRNSIGSSEEKNEPVNEPEKRECAGVAKNRQGYRRNESEVEEESANRQRRSQSSVSENK